MIIPTIRKTFSEFQFDHIVDSRDLDCLVVSSVNLLLTLEDLFVTRKRGFGNNCVVNHLKCHTIWSKIKL